MTERLAVVVTDDPIVAMRALRLGLGGRYWLANLEVWERQADGEWKHLPVSDDAQIATPLLRGVDGRSVEDLAPPPRSRRHRPPSRSAVDEEAFNLALARRAYHGREPRLIARFVNAHAGHDAEVPGRAYDLTTWRVRFPHEPTPLMLSALGIPSTAKLLSGTFVAGAQTWDYTERVASAAGSTCERCAVGDPPPAGPPVVGYVVCKVELASLVERGRAVGNLYGVAEYDHDGTRRRGYILQPQRDERRAAELADARNATLPDEVWEIMARHYKLADGRRRRYVEELAR